MRGLVGAAGTSITSLYSRSYKWRRSRKRINTPAAIIELLGQKSARTSWSRRSWHHLFVLMTIMRLDRNQKETHSLCCNSRAAWPEECEGLVGAVGAGITTGIAFYTGINDFYKPLRDFYTPFTPLYGSLRPFTNHLFAKQQHQSAIILIWFWLYHAQDQVIEAYFQ